MPRKRSFHPSLLLLLGTGACYFGYEGDGAPDLVPGDPSGAEAASSDAGPGPQGGSTGVDPGETSDETGGPTPSGPPNDCFAQEQRFDAVVEESCAICHARGAANGGFGNVTDLAGMIADGRLVVGSAEDSEFFDQVSIGAMPPTGPLDADTLSWIATFIDDCLEVIEPPACRETNALISIDTMLELMAEDIRSVDARERPFIRYLSLTHFHNANYCAATLEPFRDAMRQLVNATSTDPNIVLLGPDQAVPGSFETIYRIDLSDIGWDVPVEVDGVAFDDKWDALAAHVPTATAYDLGRVTDDLQGDSGTAIPFMMVDSMLDVAFQPPLYHVMAEIPATVGELEALLQIDRAENIRQRDVVRAGLRNSGVSAQNRLIERHEIPLGRDRAFWLSYDFVEDALDEQNLFATPFGPSVPGLEFSTSVFREAGGEVIFSLPNGFQAYMLFEADGNGDGRRLDVAPNVIVTDPAMETGEVINGISCPRCHTQILEIDDEVLPNVLSDSGLVDRDIREFLEDIHPEPADFRAIQRADTDVYRAALQAAGVTLDRRIDAMAGMFQYYLDDVDLSIAAGEMGVPPGDLQRNLGAINRLSPLQSEGGKVSRAVWEASFAEVVLEFGLGQSAAAVLVQSEQ